MEEHYGDFSFRRLNKAGLVCLALVLLLTIALLLLDIFWFVGTVSLPSFIEIPYQVIYLLWFVFLIFGAGIDKVTISEESIRIDVFYSRKKELKKTEIAYVQELGERLYFVSIVASLQIDGRKDRKLFKALEGVIELPLRYKEKVIERGFEVIS